MEDETWFLNGTLILPDQTIEDGALHIYDGRIEWVGEAAAAPTHDILDFVDLSGKILAPGFIDLQLNGGFGADFTQRPETIWEVAAQLPQYGITSFLPTIITSTPNTLERAKQVLIDRPVESSGSEPLGLHLEGPFLNPAKKGAHPEHHLRLPNQDEVVDWSPESGIYLVTLAPELQEGLDTIEQLVSNGVVASLGHTCATYAETQAAILAGTRYATHLFNAMVPNHHREPGVIGAALDAEEMVLGLIADGIHVHPAVIRQVWAQAKDRINLVSDGMAAMGCLPGEYRLGDQVVFVNKNSARLRDNTLAGAICPLDQGLRNLISWTGCTLVEALKTVTLTPANLLGMSHKGRLEAGCDADVVVLNRDLTVASTYIQGTLQKPVIDQG